jgi:hypothetical protein
MGRSGSLVLVGPPVCFPSLVTLAVRVLILPKQCSLFANLERKNQR